MSEDPAAYAGRTPPARDDLERELRRLKGDLFDAREEIARLEELLVGRDLQIAKLRAKVEELGGRIKQVGVRGVSGYPNEEGGETARPR